MNAPPWELARAFHGARFEATTADEFRAKARAWMEAPATLREFTLGQLAYQQTQAMGRLYELLAPHLDAHGDALGAIVGAMLAHPIEADDAPPSAERDAPADEADEAPADEADEAPADPLDAFLTVEAP